MKIAASNALANLISDEELNENYIIPAAFDPRVGPPWRRPWQKPPEVRRGKTVRKK